jgi:hypothetical protein
MSTPGIPNPLNREGRGRLGRTLITVLVAGLAAGSLAGCGPARDGAAEEPEVVAALAPEGAALAAIGYDPDDLATGDPVAATEPDQADGQRWRNWRARHAVRVLLHQNLLHGEVVVQTPDGPKTVLVQRGEVTALSDNGLTVTSSDGFSQSWVYAAELRVIEARSTIEPSELAVGAKVGVAGVEVDGQPTARLVVIPRS